MLVRMSESSSTSRTFLSFRVSLMGRSPGGMHPKCSSRRRKCQVSAVSGPITLVMSLLPTQITCTSPIVVIDSGLGGLTVVRALREVLPMEDIVYFGDTARLPYGSKTAD